MVNTILPSSELEEYFNAGMKDELLAAELGSPFLKIGTIKPVLKEVGVQVNV